MLSIQNTKQELISTYLKDAHWWKLALGYIENETRFIHQLLNAHIYKENTPNLFERIQKFKDEIGTIAKETNSLKEEMTGYEDQLNGFLEPKSIISDRDHPENHMKLKKRFEEFYIGVNNYKARVYNYIGGML